MMPTPLIEKPGESLGSSWGVVGESYPAYELWNGPCWVPSNPMSEYQARWGRAVQQAAYCLVVGGVVSLPVETLQLVHAVEPPAQPCVTITSAECKGTYNQGKLVYEHRKYIEGLVAAGTISSRMGWRALEIWGNLWRNCPDLTVPDAAAGFDGEVQYSWNRGDHHLSLDIIPGQSTEFFYRNRQTGMIWDAESDGSDETVSVVPVELATHLKFFLISKTA